MNVKPVLKTLSEMLSRQSRLCFNPITDDETVGVGKPIHRHDFHELRFIFPADSDMPERVDVIYPCVCHHSLSLDEYGRAHILDLLPEHPRFVHRMTCRGSFKSEYAKPALQALDRLFGHREAKVETECRLLLALVFLYADAEVDAWTCAQGRIGNFVRHLTNFYYKQDLSIAEAAREAGYSPNYIQKVFREATEMTPKEFLTRIRMEAAARFLREKRYSVKEVASLCGFSCNHYFSNTFRAYYGCPPGRFNSDQPVVTPVPAHQSE